MFCDCNNSGETIWKFIIELTKNDKNVVKIGIKWHTSSNYK
jgi:hypothetical protein